MFTTTSYWHLTLLWSNGAFLSLAPTLCLTSCYRPGVSIYDGRVALSQILWGVSNCTKCQFLHNVALKIQGSRVVAALYILLLSYTTIDLKFKKNTKTIVFALYLRWFLIIRWFLGLWDFSEQAKLASLQSLPTVAAHPQVQVDKTSRRDCGRRWVV